MSFATGLEGLVMLLKPFRIDVDRYGTVIRPKAFQWGYFKDHEPPRGWYIFIRLPFWSMKTLDYPWDYTESCWHQKTLLFKGELPAGKEGWEVRDIPV